MPSYFIFMKTLERENDYDNDELDTSEEYNAATPPNPDPHHPEEDE